MFANLKKKIESEVGDLSRLTPSLRSITGQSERLTPLSSRHNSVSSLTSETSTSYTNKLSSPLSPSDQLSSPQPHYGHGGGSTTTTPGGASNSKHDGANGGGSGSNNQLKIRRQFEEKIQTLELDFAWRLSSKDEEIAKLQKQVEHANTLLHSKEFETQQKLVRVQEDMDSLEGFSQQENAKIKHLLLNREEELSTLRAAVMFKDSSIKEFESHVKSISMENERLKKNLDEVVSRQAVAKPKSEEEEAKTEEQSKLLQELQQKVKVLEATKIDSEAASSKAIKELEVQVRDKEKSLQDLHAQLDQMTTIKNLLTKREEELSQLKASVIVKDFNIKELEGQVKTISADCDRLKKNFDEAVNNRKSEDSQVEGQLHALQQKLQVLEAAKNDFESQVQEKDKILTELEIQVEKMAAFEGLLLNREAELDQLRADFMSKDSNIKTLENQVKSITIENERLQNNLKEVENQRAEGTEVEEHYRQLQQKVEILEAANISLETQSKQKDSVLDGLKTQVVEMATLKKLLSDGEGELRQLRDDGKSKKSSITERENQVKNITRENEQLKKNLEEVTANRQSQNSVVEEQSKLQQQKIQSLEADKTNLNSQVQEKDKILAELQAQLDQIPTFKNLLLNREQELDQLRADIRSKESDVAKLGSQVKKLDTAKSELETSTSATIRNLETQVQEKNTTLVELQAQVDQIATFKNLLANRDQELSQIRADVLSKEANINELQSQLKNISMESEQVKKNLDEVIASRQLEGSNIEEQSRVLQQQVELLEAAKKDLESVSAETIMRLESEIQEKDKTLTELQVTVDEMSTFELENSDLVLQISEIQSKYDELEEENKFLKDAAPKDEYEALKRKIGDMEGDLLDKTQMLKQQSLQLQDLRRSLAKEINKNQALSETASPMELAVQPNGIGGAMNQMMSTSPAPSSTQPPTLPPQETDVNFMYLRSVLFKYLTTTDAQVSHQLTRVVATLLHLNEEESHQLLQSTESRNSFFHLLGKS